MKKLKNIYLTFIALILAATASLADRVSMIFSNTHKPKNLIPEGQEMSFAVKDAEIELETGTLPVHERDAETLILVPWDRAAFIRIMELFPDAELLDISEFFGKLA